MCILRNEPEFSGLQPKWPTSLHIGLGFVETLRIITLGIVIPSLLSVCVKVQDSLYQIK